MLDRLQLGLERLYRIETELDVAHFLMPFPGVQTRREQLLVAEEEGELSIGLCLDDEVLKALEHGEVDHHMRENLEPFLLAVEGVSHFVCVAWNARRDRKITALELELQAEVDKYVTCLLSMAPANSERLRQRLFVDVEFEADLSAEESDRYRLANQAAYRYAGTLEERFVKTGRIVEMLPELRRFYRLPLDGKLALAR
jgi:hypothetical protein